MKVRQVSTQQSWRQHFGERKTKEKRHIIQFCYHILYKGFFQSYQTLSGSTSFVSSLMWQHNMSQENLKGTDCFRSVLFKNTIFSQFPVFHSARLEQTAIARRHRHFCWADKKILLLDMLCKACGAVTCVSLNELKCWASSIGCYL